MICEKEKRIKQAADYQQENDEQEQEHGIALHESLYDWGILYRWGVASRLFVLLYLLYLFTCFTRVDMQKEKR